MTTKPVQSTTGARPIALIGYFVRLFSPRLQVTHHVLCPQASQKRDYGHSEENDDESVGPLIHLADGAIRRLTGTLPSAYLLSTLWKPGN